MCVCHILLFYIRGAPCSYRFPLRQKITTKDIDSLALNAIVDPDFDVTDH